MNVSLLSNLPPLGESIAKTASKGGQLINDIVGVSAFFAFCLLLVGACLIVPNHLYEKYFKVADDRPDAEAPATPEPVVQRTGDPAA